MKLSDELCETRRRFRDSRNWGSSDKVDFVLDALFAITEAIDELVERVEALEKKEKA
jgi:hypothetical protein